MLALWAGAVSVVLTGGETLPRLVVDVQRRPDPLQEGVNMQRDNAASADAAAAAAPDGPAAVALRRGREVERLGEGRDDRNRPDE